VATLYTIGHSTRTIDELISVLRAHDIQTLVDIRAFPMSRRLPHFNREALEASLQNAGIRYLWMKALGGYRKKIREDSPNTGLRNASFRNYADYMLTPEFEASVGELLEEGQAFEAEFVRGVENAQDADVAEVTTTEVLEDDVPSEYLDNDR